MALIGTVVIVVLVALLMYAVSPADVKTIIIGGLIIAGIAISAYAYAEPALHHVLSKLNLQ